MEDVNQDTQVEQQTPQAPVADTPTNAFDENTGSENTMSFEDVIFGPEGERKPAEVPPRTPEQVANETRAIESQNQAPTPDAQQEYQAKNDDKRFEYWQSQAAQLQNQLEQQREATNSLTKHLNEAPQGPRYTSAGPMAGQPEAQVAPEAEEGFPPPPDRPAKPRNFSREAAYTDATSESAAYLDAIDEWRDDMDEYTGLKSEYEQAKMQEYMQNQESQRQKMVQRQQMAAEQQRQVGEIDKYVQGQYGFTAEESREFISQYSDPKSVTMENLVQLYRLNKGQPLHGNGPQQVPNSPQIIDQRPPEPSATFQQQQRAQQVPSPVGVQSGLGNSNPDDGLPQGQKFMDALIGNHNKNTAF